MSTEQCKYLFTPVEQGPEYDGDYCCMVDIAQECGNIWKRLKVITLHFNKWQVEDNIKVTHYLCLANLTTKELANGIALDVIKHIELRPDGEIDKTAALDRLIQKQSEWL